MFTDYSYDNLGVPRNPLIAANDAGEAVCYNLVVADFGNYFVGEEKALVHDNTIRDVTPAIVPGLVTR